MREREIPGASLSQEEEEEERSRPVLMSGESVCPIIEAMLRAQIAETGERGRG